MTRKYKNRKLPRGILIFEDHVYIRIFPQGRKVMKCIGLASRPGVMDEAVSKLNQWRDQIRQGRLEVAGESKRITMSTACDVFWELHGSKAASVGTRRTFKLCLSNIRRLLGQKWVDEVTDADIRYYRERRAREFNKRHAGQLIRPLAINRDHSVLISLFNRLKEWRRVQLIENIRLPDENPARLVSKASERGYIRNRVLTQEEFETFLECCPEQVKRACLAEVNTLLRLKDLMRFKVSVNFNRVKNRLEGIQAKTITAKNPAGLQYSIPVNGVLEWLTKSAVKDSFADFENFRKLFDAARDEAKKKGVAHFQFRDLRRTSATWMLEQGADLDTIRRQLGHADITMTVRYLNVQSKHQVEAAQVLGTRFLKHIPQTVSKTVSKEPSPRWRNRSKTVEI